VISPVTKDPNSTAYVRLIQIYTDPVTVVNRRPAIELYMLGGEPPVVAMPTHWVLSVVEYLDQFCFSLSCAVVSSAKARAPFRARGAAPLRAAAVWPPPKKTSGMKLRLFLGRRESRARRLGTQCVQRPAPTRCRGIHRGGMLPAANVHAMRRHASLLRSGVSAPAEPISRIRADARYISRHWRDARATWTPGHDVDPNLSFDML
jgi:hypothetical protein